MRLSSVLLAVSDLERSKNFYKKIFNQTIELDLGENVTFSGGFTIQLNFERLVKIPKESIIKKSNNMELYFEVNDFDEFIKKLTAYPEIEYVNQPMQYEWKQRVVRIYDPDYHMIEIGESMKVIARRYLSQGYSIKEVSAIIQHPIEFVRICL